MNPLLLAKAAPWFICALLALMLAAMTHLYMGERDELAAEKANFKSFAESTAAIGEAAKAAKKATEDAHAQNLVQIKEEHESQVQRIRNEAVANYFSGRHAAVVRQWSAANPGGGVLPRNGPGISLDDATQRQCLPDEALIQDAAEDAAKLGAWQQYCTLNHCPVKD